MLPRLMDLSQFKVLKLSPRASIMDFSTLYLFDPLNSLKVEAVKKPIIYKEHMKIKGAGCGI